MPTARDKRFADLLLNVAIDLDDLCERLNEAADTRADGIIADIRAVEDLCNELRDQVDA